MQIFTAFSCDFHLKPVCSALFGCFVAQTADEAHHGIGGNDVGSGVDDGIGNAVVERDVSRGIPRLLFVEIVAAEELRRHLVLLQRGGRPLRLLSRLPGVVDVVGIGVEGVAASQSSCRKVCRVVCVILLFFI